MSCKQKYSKGLGCVFLCWFQGGKIVDISMTCLWRKLGQLKYFCFGYQIKIQLNVMICGWDRWSCVAWFRNFKSCVGFILIEDLIWIHVNRTDYWLLKQRWSRPDFSWSFNNFFFEINFMNPSSLHSILKSYGINWFLLSKTKSWRYNVWVHTNPWQAWRILKLPRLILPKHFALHDLWAICAIFILIKFKLILNGLF